MLTLKNYMHIGLLSLLMLLICWSCEKDKEDSKPTSNLAEEILKQGSGLRLGISVADINPENDEGFSLEGYGPRTSTGTHDALTARSMVVLDDNSVVALIALDLIGINQSQIRSLKSRIVQSTGIKDEHIFIHAIHTHSGPSIMDGRVSGDYLKMLYSQVSDATEKALNSVVNVNAIFKSGTADVNAINRRNPARPLNNSFNLIEFQNNTGITITTLLNYSCHPVVLGPDNPKISADYVYYLRKKVEAQLGGTAIFFNGSFGNINPEVVHSSRPYDRSAGTFEMAQTMGEALADKMLNNYTLCDTSVIALKSKTAFGSLDGQNTNASILDLGIGQIALLPGEPLESFGIAVKELLPGKYKMVFGATNDFIGYIIPESEWQQCTSSFIEGCFEETVGGGEQVAPMLLQALEQLCAEMFNQ